MLTIETKGSYYEHADKEPSENCEVKITANGKQDVEYLLDLVNEIIKHQAI